MAENAPQALVTAEPATPTATETEAKTADKMESQSNPPGGMMAAAHVIAPGVLSIFSFFLSLALLGCAVWLLFMRSYDCEDLLGLPRVQTLASVGLLAVFAISNAALYQRQRFPMPVVVVIVVTLLLMLFLGLAYSGVNEMQSQRFPATASWFKMKVMDDSNWNNIKSCIYDKGTCNELVYRSLRKDSYDLISNSKMSSVQSGCCIPPKTCEMEEVNATSWRRKEEMEYDIENEDCEMWRKEWSVLCYDCRSCKLGFIRALRRKWWKLGVFCIVMSLLLLLSHLLLFLATFWERLKT
ncbi:PREDICTED: tetraspanin-15 [Tarenaya hassleriana]|uniref:tetraspanin-15 n=1 Tax=Tarenaya hassleriana TaxID=28532 RepID=UPI0008FD600E|nr:PREDICTED: tetraspanin-15 [Tarenaya hassleriana]